MEHKLSIKQVVKPRDFIGLALLTVVFVAVFLAGFKYIGTLSAGHHQWLTAETMKFTENWAEDGIQNDNFLTIEVPKSIEYQELSVRGIYSSYPIGAQLPILLFKKILPNVDTLTIIHTYGYINLYLIAVLIYFLVIFSRINTNEDVRIFAILASVSYLLLPSTRYWHSLVYFADQAVILPFVLILFTELIIRKFNSKFAKYLQYFFLFWGMTIDYLIIPLCIVLYLFRLLEPLRGDGKRKIIDLIEIFSPISIAIFIQIIILYLNDLILPLYKNFLFRAGLNDEGSKLIFSFFEQFWLGGLGPFPFAIYSLNVLIGIILIIKRKYLLGNIIGLIGLISCTFQVLLLRNHSAIHDFSALKFYMPMCFLFFGYYPSILYSFLYKNKNYSKRALSLIKVFISLVLVSILILWCLFERDRFSPPAPDFRWKQLAFYLRENSKFEDVYIGLDEVDIGPWPPQTLAISRKIVHSFNDPDKLKYFLESLPIAARVTVLYTTEKTCLTSASEASVIPDTNVKAVRLNRESYELLLECY